MELEQGWDVSLLSRLLVTPSDRPPRSSWMDLGKFIENCPLPIVVIKNKFIEFFEKMQLTLCYFLCIEFLTKNFQLSLPKLISPERPDFIFPLIMQLCFLNPLSKQHASEVLKCFDGTAKEFSSGKTQTINSHPNNWISFVIPTSRQKLQEKITQKFYGNKFHQ